MIYSKINSNVINLALLRRAIYSSSLGSTFVIFKLLSAQALHASLDSTQNLVVRSYLLAELAAPNLCEDPPMPTELLVLDTLLTFDAF